MYACEKSIDELKTEAKEIQKQLEHLQQSIDACYDEDFAIMLGRFMLRSEEQEVDDFIRDFREGFNILSYENLQEVLMDELTKWRKYFVVFTCQEKN